MATANSINSGQLLATSSSPTFSGMTLSTLSIGTGALTGTNAAVTFSSALTDGIYASFGGGGRSIGVFTAGNFFLTANLSYDGTANSYLYTANTGASAIELGVSGGFLRYAPGGTAGSIATVSNALLWDTSGNVNIQNGNLLVGTATKGIQLKSAAVSAGSANSLMVTGCVLVGGTVTITDASVTTSHRGIPMLQTAGGTLGSWSVVCGSGTFTINSTNPLDTSTLSVLFVLPN